MRLLLHLGFWTGAFACSVNTVAYAKNGAGLNLGVAVFCGFLALHSLVMLAVTE